jgi:hypothetical protein
MPTRERAEIKKDAEKTRDTSLNPPRSSSFDVPIIRSIKPEIINKAGFASP